MLQMTIQSKRLRSLLLYTFAAAATLILALPAIAWAQGAGGDARALQIDLKQIIAVLITGVGIPLAVMILTQVWPNAPTWLKTIAAPVIVPGLIYLAGLATAWLGVPISFQDIIDVITSVAVPTGLGASVAYRIGKTKGLLAR